MYISFDDNFGHSTKFDNIFTLTEERWGFMVSIHVLVNGDTFPLQMLGSNADDNDFCHNFEKITFFDSIKFQIQKFQIHFFSFIPI